MIDSILFFGLRRGVCHGIMQALASPLNKLDSCLAFGERLLPANKLRV
jgi:hypothetical protein